MLRKLVACCFSRRAYVSADNLGLVSAGVLQGLQADTLA
jgi:hypothetical protein